MYSKYENPMLKASIFYYDKTYDVSVSARVLSVLKEHGMFPPEKIHADRLTSKRYVKANRDTENIFIKAYSENNVMGVDMASGDGQVGSEYWRFSWDFTFYKNSNIDLSKVVFKPWNIISLSSTYDRLKSVEAYNDYMDCVKDIIVEIKPFYACIDDVENRVKLSGTQGLRIDDNTPPNEVYWGNFWCNNYVNNSNPKAFEYLCRSGAIIERLADGIFFCMTDSPLDYKASSVVGMERQFRKMMKRM